MKMIVRAWAVAMLALLLGAAAPAHAADGLDEKVAQLSRQLGVDDAILAYSRNLVSQSSTFSKLKSEKSDCVATAINEQITLRMRQGFRDVFGDEKTVQTWLDFLATPVGEKYKDIFSMGMNASIHEQPTSDAEVTEYMNNMSVGQVREMKAFIDSPAGSVLGKDKIADAFVMTEEQERAVGMKIISRCKLSGSDLN